MVKISLNPKFWWESLLLFKKKGPKQILFGNKVSLNDKEKKLLDWAKKNSNEVKKGSFIKKDIVHKGSGSVYLFSDKKNKNNSILLFDDRVKIRSGPDLYVYLSINKDPRKGLGKFINLGLLKGTSGGQSYVIKDNLENLNKYKTAVIYCKKFEELFTFAELK